MRNLVALPHWPLTIAVTRLSRPSGIALHSDPISSLKFDHDCCFRTCTRVQERHTTSTSCTSTSGLPALFALSPSPGLNVSWNLALTSKFVLGCLHRSLAPGAYLTWQLQLRRDWCSSGVIGDAQPESDSSQASKQDYTSRELTRYIEKFKRQIKAEKKLIEAGNTSDKLDSLLRQIKKLNAELSETEKREAVTAELKSWRNSIRGRTGHADLISNDTLSWLCRVRPVSVDQLKAEVPGEKIEDWGEEAVATVWRASMRFMILNAKPRKSALKHCESFKESSSIADLAAADGCNTTTVVGNLADCLAAGIDTPLDSLLQQADLSQSMAHTVAAALRSHASQGIRAVRDAAGYAVVGYGQIKLVAFLMLQGLFDEAVKKLPA